MGWSEHGNAFKNTFKQGKEKHLALKLKVSYIIKQYYDKLELLLNFSSSEFSLRIWLSLIWDDIQSAS